MDISFYGLFKGTQGLFEAIPEILPDSPERVDQIISNIIGSPEKHEAKQRMSKLNETFAAFASASPSERNAAFAGTTESVALQQAYVLLAAMKETYGYTDDEAKQHLSAQLAAAAVERGGDPDQIFASYPPALQKLIIYKPSELKLNQDITKWGAILTPFLFLTGGGLVAFAAFRGIAAAAPWIAEATSLTSAGKDSMAVANAISLSRAAAFPKVVLPGVLGTVISGLAWYVSTAVNNWNDVFHWGKQQQQSLNLELNKLSRQMAGLGSGFAQTEKTRVAEYKTARPKLFTGIIYNGQVGPYEQFVRAVDDKITSDADLKTDVEINLAKYFATIDNNLSYSIQIKNSPSDELGIPRSGTWATLSIYLTNQFHKRVFIDEILLGPVDPFVYYPESQKVEQLQYEIPKLVKFDNLHPIDVYRGGERIVDTAGNIITDVLRDGTQVVAPVSVTAPSAQSAPAITAGATKAMPNSISAEGVSQHNQPPLFGTLYRARGNEGLVFNPWPELYTQEEINKLSADPGKFGGNEQKLKDRGVNTSQVRQFQYHDLEPYFKLQRREVGFSEFFGVSALPAGFPKQVTVTVDKLNVRSQATSQSATAGSMQLTRGDVFTAVALVEGESVSGNNKWYKSSLGHFVWSGGAS